MKEIYDTNNAEITGLGWSNNRMLPAFQTPTHLDVYDIFGASPDTQLTITTLVGLVNRPQPQVYLVMGGDEEFWRNEVFMHIPQTVSAAKGNAALAALLQQYKDIIQGMVIYDPKLTDSINIATMIAALQGSIVVSPQQASIIATIHAFPVLTDLRTYGWQSRAQAYDWALHNLRANCSSRLVAGLDPKNMNLRPFLVATRAFIYFLDSRDYLPDFNDNLTSERHLMNEILATFPVGTTHLGWFLDESSGVALTSKAAIPVLATDNFTNLEVWSAVQPLSDTPSQQSVHAINTAVPEDEKVYVSFTFSDGDNLQYCQHHMKDIWRDSIRGEIPIGWTIAPALRQLTPTLADYYQHSASSNDEFIAGPSGAGYMFPSHWPSEQLPDFLQKTGERMQDMGLTLLEVLDTQWLESSGIPVLSKLIPTGMIFFNEELQQQFVQALRPSGLQGMLSGAGLRHPSWKVIDSIPFYQNLGLAGSVKQTVDMIQRAIADNVQRPLFLNVYILAWSMNPTLIKQVVQQLGEQCEIVLPSTLLAMLSKAQA